MRFLGNGVRGGIFALFLVANPAYFTGCAGEEEFTYDEADMLTLLDDVSSAGVLAFEEYEVELSLAQGEGATASLTSLIREPMNALPTGAGVSLVASAHACESRSFVKSAAACVAYSEMPVDGTMKLFRTLVDGEREKIDEMAVEGSLVVDGLHLTSAYLMLGFNDGFLEAVWDDERHPSFELSSFNSFNLGENGEGIRYDWRDE